MMRYECGERTENMRVGEDLHKRDAEDTTDKEKVKKENNTRDYK